MIELGLKPQFTINVPPRQLQEGYLVYFTKAWPTQLTHVSGKVFRVDVVNQVPYDLSYIIPASDYKEVDLSNGDDGEKLYPTKATTLYEVFMGLKTGNYLAQIQIPSSQYLSYLEYTGMTPVLTDSSKRYIGARKPSDSPYSDPRIKMYFVKDLAPLILRLYVLPGVDYEKVVLGLHINKCQLREIKEPSDEEMLKAKVIRYYEEERW